MLRAVLSWAIWPIGVASFLASVLYFSDLENPRSISDTAGRSFLVALLVLLAIELLLPYRADWKVRGDRDVWRDLGHFVLYVGGQFLAQLIFILGFVTLVGTDWRGIWPTNAPLVLQVLLVLVLGDFFEYWLHRLSHTWPLLWRVHAIHHMPTRLHMLKAGRHHILYFPLRGLIVWLPLLLLGVPPELIVWQFVGATLTGNIDHANIDFRRVSTRWGSSAIRYRIVSCASSRRHSCDQDSDRANSARSTVAASAGAPAPEYVLRPPRPASLHSS